MKKDHCVICECRIHTDDYEVHGNFCYACCGRAQNVVNKVITREQADRLVKERARAFCEDCRHNTSGVCVKHI